MARRLDHCGRIQHHHYDEGGYEVCESVIQEPLRDAAQSMFEITFLEPGVEAYCFTFG